MKIVITSALITMLAVIAGIGPAFADATSDALAAAQAADARHDYATELKLLRPLAEQGDALAQMKLGTMYYRGYGVSKDDAEAVRWFRRAADQGDALAQAILATMYRDGQGVSKDDAEAVRWFRRAADQGYASAQGDLGVMYAQGLGVPKDYVEAVRWFRKAADQGDALAQKNLGDMYHNGYGVSENYAEAARWMRKAAEQREANAQFLLGYMYQQGQGVPEDYAEAVRWYRKAAAQGNAVGQLALGTMYHDGDGVPKDYVQSYMWLNLAAAGGINKAVQFRNKLEHLMTPEQIAEAQRRTAEWRPVQPVAQQPAALPTSAANNQEPSSRQLGTAFFISESGVLLTNAHVVVGCSEVSIGAHKLTSPPTPERIAKAKAAGFSDEEIKEVLDEPLTARVIARDTENDLALLRTTAHPTAVAALRLSVRQGEAATAYGYPLPGLLASGGNMTEGNVTALSGIGDDSRLLQISAPVQPGNSGGPLLDAGGNVIGIVEGKLDAIKVASAIGDVPQNVNFAIKTAVVATFLDSNGIHYATGQLSTTRSPADIAEEAKHFTVPIECLGTVQ